MNFKHKKRKKNNADINVHGAIGGDEKVILETNLKTCRKYSSETLSCFIDRELTEKEYSAIEEHLATCLECKNIINTYQSLEGHFTAGMTSALSSMDTARLKSRIMAGTDGENLNRQNTVKEPTDSGFSPSEPWKDIIRKLLHGKQPFFSNQFFNTRKFYLQLTSVAAIILVSISMIYLQKEPSFSGGPSAIITSVDGDISSVMILETQEEKHTIIWYKEV